MLRIARSASFSFFFPSAGKCNNDPPSDGRSYAHSALATCPARSLDVLDAKSGFRRARENERERKKKAVMSRASDGGSKAWLRKVKLCGVNQCGRIRFGVGQSRSTMVHSSAFWITKSFCREKPFRPTAPYG